MVNVLSSVSAIRISRSLRAGRGLDGGALLRVGLRDHQQLVVLHVLLLDGGAAAGVEVAGHVARQTRQGALPVHTVVLGKPFVLDGDDRQLHRVGDLVAGHLEPALRVQPGDDVALGVDHRRHPRAPRPRRVGPSRWQPHRRPGSTSARTRRPRETSAPAATTLANRQHHASLMTVTVAGGRFGGRSGMRYRVARSRVGSLADAVKIASITGLTVQLATRANVGD